ncbi:hypothetical protein [Aeromonas hydrophila]|uniref:hypothetical protein n=1 Tax=Aeromonas hydrophila TaxID=644 RepID=UPI002B46FD50|nr:hypothetical protein [Aeromonas hydrophila]
MNTKMKNILIGLGVAAASMPAFADASQGLGRWVSNAIDFMGLVSQGAMNFALLAGVVFGLIFIFTCKSLGKPNQEPGKATTAVISLILCVALVGYDQFIKDSTKSISGKDGASSGSAVNKENFGL